ncbi:hypothetical protein D3C73_1514070 [compost metagenome]
MGEEGHHQLGHHGQVQLRPLHPGLRGPDLEIEELQRRLTTPNMKKPRIAGFFYLF